MRHVRDLGGDVFTIKEFAEMLEMGAFTDDDGYGFLVEGNIVDDRYIYPSTFFETNLEKATDIIWFNR